jgi:hypothetical protein
MDVVGKTSAHPPTSKQGNHMNINKHMEVIFITTLAVVGTGSYLADRLPAAKAGPAETDVPVARNIGTPGHPAVVIVRASREARRA